MLAFQNGNEYAEVIGDQFMEHMTEEEAEQSLEKLKELKTKIEQIAEWKERAENGNAIAQFNLGVTYYHAKGVPQDYKEAVKWFLKAAEQGYVDAQYNLGGAYLFGNGVIEDNIQAYAWYNIAAANGNELAKKGKTTVAEEMTKEQIAKAQDLSTEMVKANPRLMGD